MQSYTNIEAERVLIATLFANEKARDEVFSGAGLLSAQHFSVPVLGLVFSALEQLFYDGTAPSLIELTSRVERGGYLLNDRDSRLVSEVVTTAEVSSEYMRCVDIITAKHLGRQGASVLSEMSQAVSAAVDPETVRANIERAQARLEEMQSAFGGKVRKGSFLIGDFVMQSLDKLQELADRQDDSPVTGVPSGIDDLDEMTTGFQDGDLIVVGGRPSMGKTATVLTFADTAAEHFERKKEPGVVVVYSMEMPGQSLANRMLSARGKIDLQAIRTGKLTDDQWQRLVEAVEYYQKNKRLLICEESVITPSFIRADLRQKRRQYGRIGMVVVDYLGLMDVDGTGRRNDTRANEVAGISRELKRIAKDENCPVVALAQLNRLLETRPNKRPIMSDLRDSGGIEQDADLICFLYRDEYYNPDSKDKGVLELIVGKQRNGPCGVVRAYYDGRYTSVGNLAKSYSGM